MGNSHNFVLEFEWTYECGLVKLLEIGTEYLNFELKTMVYGCICNVSGKWLEESWLGLNSCNGSCFEMLGFGYVLKELVHDVVRNELKFVHGWNWVWFEWMVECLEWILVLCNWALCNANVGFCYKWAHIKMAHW